MNMNTMLEDYGQVRIDSALENALRVSERYQKSARRAEKKLRQVYDMGISKKQKEAVGRAVAAQNFCGSEYGREAYFQGLKDGLRMMKEVSKVLQLEEI